MGSFGGFYSGDKKKPKKARLEEKAKKLSNSGAFILPKVEIISRKKKEEWQ